MNEGLFVMGTSPTLKEHDTEKTLVLGTFTLPSTVDIHQRENRENRKNLWLPQHAFVILYIAAARDMASQSSLSRVR